PQRTAKPSGRNNSSHPAQRAKQPQPTQPPGRNILPGSVSHRSPTPKEPARPSGRNNTTDPAQRAKHTCRWRKPPVPNPQRTRQAQRAKQHHPPSPEGETYLPVASATGPQPPKNSPSPAGETTPATQPSGRNILAGGVSHRSP